MSDKSKYDNPYDEHEDDELSGSRSARLLKMLALDGAFDLKQGLRVAVPAMLLLVLAVLGAPWVMEQQRGTQLVEATLSYPELVSSASVLVSNAPVVLANASSVEERGATEPVFSTEMADISKAVRAGRILAWVPILIEANDKEALQRLFAQLEIPKAQETDADVYFLVAARAPEHAEFSTAALTITRAYFQDDALRPFFELGVWLEKSFQALGILTVTGKEQVLGKSFEGRHRLLRGALQLPHAVHWKSQLEGMQQAELNLEEEASVEHWQQRLMVFAASF